MTGSPAELRARVCERARFFFFTAATHEGHNVYPSTNCRLYILDYGRKSVSHNPRLSSFLPSSLILRNVSSGRLSLFCLLSPLGSFLLQSCWAVGCHEEKHRDARCSSPPHLHQNICNQPPPSHCSYVT